MREVNLNSYLPDYMREYRDIKETLAAEDVEFNGLWETINNSFYNRFIETADENGIARYEGILGLYPDSLDGLEARRDRVRSRWFNTMPYTMQGLKLKIGILCGESDYKIYEDFASGYTMIIETNLESYGKIDELNQIIATMIPCNMVITIGNSITVDEIQGNGYVAGTVTNSFLIEVSNMEQEEYNE